MLVQEIKFDPLRIQSIADTDTDLPPRTTTTLHASTIYSDLEQTIAPIETDYGEKELKVFRAGGFLWERVWSAAMAEAIRGGDIVRPGEFTLDGITGSPDNWDTRTGRVIETKATWKSSNKYGSWERYFWAWLVQMKGYCRLLGTNEAELYIFFAVGDYKGSGPQTKAALFQWSWKEIDDNWKMLKGHARKKGWLR